MSEALMEIASMQDFLHRFVGRCSKCGHAMQKISEVHVSGHYPSGLTLSPTHWAITEVDEGEDTGIGCSECEKGYMHAVNKDRFELALQRAREDKGEEWLNVYCQTS